MTIENQNFKFKKNLKKRILATLFDYGLYFLSFYVYALFVGDDNGKGGYTVNGLLTLPVFLVWFIYFVVIEAYAGATLAHQGYNLKVLTLKREDIDFTHALKRHLLDPIDILIYGIPALLAINNTDKHQRLGDLWANTLVVDTTDPDQYPDQQTT